MKKILSFLVFLSLAAPGFSQGTSYYELLQEIKKKNADPAYRAARRDSIFAKYRDGRVRIERDLSDMFAIFASPDPDAEGEILVYYYICNRENYKSDTVFIVMNKAECENMVSSMRAVETKLKEWKKVARQNNIDNYSKEMDIPFPEVNVYWKRLHPDFGRRTYDPLFHWSGKDNWLHPIGHIAQRGNGELEFRFTVPDPSGEYGYIVDTYLGGLARERLVRHLDYSAIKKKYYELSADKSKWDELFK